MTDAGLDGLRQAIAQAVRPNQVRRTLHLDDAGCGGQLRSVPAQCRARRAAIATTAAGNSRWNSTPREIAKLLGAAGVALVDVGGARREQRVA